MYNFRFIYSFEATAVDAVCVQEQCISNLVTVAQSSGIEGLKWEASRLLATLLKNARTSGNLRNDFRVKPSLRKRPGRAREWRHWISHSIYYIMSTSDCPGGNFNFNINSNAQQILRTICWWVMVFLNIKCAKLITSFQETYCSQKW